jgi:predicted pyridoxine 5'-phosphate oxidase superfamily flavin-nucleotide-binding protein
VTADVLPDPATPFGQRMRARLQNDEVIWIITVGADGRPQPNPVGFCQDGDEIMDRFAHRDVQNDPRSSVHPRTPG